MNVYGANQSDGIKFAWAKCEICAIFPAFHEHNDL